MHEDTLHSVHSPYLCNVGKKWWIKHFKSICLSDFENFLL